MSNLRVFANPLSLSLKKLLASDLVREFVPVALKWKASTEACIIEGALGGNTPMRA